MDSDEEKAVGATVKRSLDFIGQWTRAGHEFTQSLYCRYCGMSYVAFTMNWQYTDICTNNFKRQIEAAIERDEKSHGKS